MIFDRTTYSSDNLDFYGSGEGQEELAEIVFENVWNNSEKKIEKDTVRVFSYSEDFDAVASDIKYDEQSYNSCYTGTCIIDDEKYIFEKDHSAGPLHTNTLVYQIID